MRSTLFPKVKIEVICTDENLQTVIDTILQTAQTGQIGDGKIFVTDLQDSIRIRHRGAWGGRALSRSRFPVGGPVCLVPTDQRSCELTRHALRNIGWRLFSVFARVVYGQVQCERW